MAPHDPDQTETPAHPPPGRWMRRHGLSISLFLGFWTVIGLSFASQFYLSSSHFGYYSVTWGQAIGITLGDWYVWALLSLGIVWFGRHFPLHRRNWARLVVIHAAASAIVCVVYVAIRAAVGQIQGPSLGMPTPFLATAQRLFLKNSLFNLLIYWVILAVGHAFDYYRKFHEREWRTAELERRLVQARLAALQMQLNPHFLFNTLHTISALMHKDVEAADRMITRLSELLRLALDHTEASQVPLRQELDFLQRYLEIERTRFGPRLAVRLEVAEDTLEALVPNLILQPLVENAIRHGIEPYSRPGRVEIAASRDGNRLDLRVRDNGGGVRPKPNRRQGVGLANTRARLDHLYGPRHQFEFGPAPDGGVLVRILIPFQPGAAAEPPPYPSTAGNGTPPPAPRAGPPAAD